MKRQPRHFYCNVIVIVLIIIAICSCNSLPTRKHKPQSLYGMIYDRDNRPVNNVILYVNNKPMAVSDIQGRFIIPKLNPQSQYTIAARKDAYEEVVIEISFIDPSDVLYIRLYSADQLLAEAEDALKGKDWDRTESLLIRAQNAGGNDIAIQFLHGVLLYYKKEYRQALAILSELSEIERNAPYLFLFMADLCQYYLEDPAEASRHLDKFLSMQFDPAIQRRRDELASL